MAKLAHLLAPLAIACLLALVSAGNFPTYTDLYVNDFAGLLSANEPLRMHNLLKGLDANTTVEVALVTINTAAPYSPSEYRTLLFREWGIGKSGKDNGLLILYAATERRIEVEVGYGLEGILPDSRVGRLLDEYYVPLRDQNKTVDGILSFTTEIAAIIRAEYDGGEPAAVDELFDCITFVFILCILIVLFVIVIKAAKRGGQGTSSGGFSHGGYGGGFGGSHYGGSFGGGFGGGFGSGRSGGGGAGR